MSATKNRRPETQQLKPSFPGYHLTVSINQRHAGNEVVQQRGDLRNDGVARDEEGSQCGGHITVRVATHLDISADARGRARLPLRPRADEFTAPEVDVPGVCMSDGAEAEPGAPAGDDSEPIAVPAQEWTLGGKCRFSWSSQELVRIAYLADRRAAAVLSRYKEDFCMGMGAVQLGLISRAAVQYNAHSDYVPVPGCRRELEECQKRLFDHHRVADAPEEEDSGPRPSRPSGVPCPGAYFASLPPEARPSGFVLQRVASLARQSPPIVLGEDQLDMLTLRYHS